VHVLKSSSGHTVCLPEIPVGGNVKSGEVVGSSLSEVPTRKIALAIGLVGTSTEVMRIPIIFADLSGENLHSISLSDTQFHEIDGVRFNGKDEIVEIFGKTKTLKTCPFIYGSPAGAK